ncbi:MAG TPA: PEGA domain-containing protein [Vicinamibacterales bacterium]|nr:PEGA domain-containing protein [Vicinamibacterales bacterium]
MAPTAVVEAEALHQEPGRMAYEPPLFASTIEEPRRRSGLGIWFTAAASLVLGIVIGFASGYRAGQGSPGAPVAVEGPAPTSGSASPGRPFTESSVPDPVRIEPEEIVPAPAPVPAPVPAPAPAPRPARVAPRQSVPPVVVEEKPQLTGAASLQVVSRPPGAEVIVDGKSVGRTPLSMEMSPGAHEVRLSLPGFKGWATTVDVKAGSTTRVSGSLEQ